MEVELQEGFCEVEVEKKKKEKLLQFLEKFTDSFWMSLDLNEKIKVEMKPKEEENLNNLKEKFLQEMKKNG